MKIDLRRREHSLFGSASLTAHAARGAVAALITIWANVGEELHPWASLAAGAVALIALRGCPVCWTIGLFETMRAKLP